VDIRRKANDVRMQVRDDGKSFDVEAGAAPRKKTHLGLLGMQERVEMVRGKFSIESKPGQGTVVQVQIPFHNGDRHPRRS
jgi:signal transduction histidine kinase